MKTDFAEKSDCKKYIRIFYKMSSSRTPSGRTPSGRTPSGTEGKKEEKLWMGGPPPKSGNTFKDGINKLLYKARINAIWAGGNGKSKKSNKKSGKKKSVKKIIKKNRRLSHMFL